MPGVITPWKVRAAPDGKSLTQDQVRALKPDDTWTAESLPEPESRSTSWLDQERLLGFAVSMDSVFGVGKPMQGVATVVNDDKDTRQVYFNTGAQLRSRCG